MQAILKENSRLHLKNLFLPSQDTQNSVAIYQGNSINHGQFLSDVKNVLDHLYNLPYQHWVLFHSEAYPFAVALMALCLKHSNDKTVDTPTIIIPGNITAHTLQILENDNTGRIGEMHNGHCNIESFLNRQPQHDNKISLPTLHIEHCHLTIFTSGSSGEAKAINKTLVQLENEINGLEKTFEAQLPQDKSIIAATVSHQHIYGLLFRVLWPLAARRTFMSEQILDSAYLLKNMLTFQQPTIWVASPAHLKRLNETLNWHSCKQHLSLIFSSGGPLNQQIAQYCWDNLQLHPLEVFGSSETGGIAYRQQLIEAAWTLLPGISMRNAKNNALEIKSPHIDANQWYTTDDAATLLSNNTFELKGRLDRIIKLEEKRLSLPELELCINAYLQVTDSYCLTLDKDNNLLQAPQRIPLACVCQLSESGHAFLEKQGKLALVNNLKKHLKQYFELSLIPKKWRFVTAIPSNSQAKIDKQAIQRLFDPS